MSVEPKGKRSEPYRECRIPIEWNMTSKSKVKLSAKQMEKRFLATREGSKS